MQLQEAEATLFIMLPVFIAPMWRGVVVVTFKETGKKNE